jgi:hypothetical protein
MCDIWEQIRHSHSTKINLDGITKKKRQNKSYAEKMPSNLFVQIKICPRLESQKLHWKVPVLLSAWRREK